MKKILSFFLTITCLLIIDNTIAQTTGSYRFSYEFTFQRDTNDVNSKMKELFVLDVFKDHSSFVSFNKLRNDKYLDSLLKSVESAGGVGSIRSINIRKPGGSASENVIYKFPDGHLEFQRKISGGLYGYKEDWHPAWNITDSVATYANYHCQVATITYGGRNWKAWFTTDIPVQDGPYKFMGLPGLIVRMEDDKGQCLYELTEVKDFTDGNNSIPKADLVSKNDFIKMVENGINRPFSAGMAGKTISMKDKEGNPISMEEMEKRRQDARRKNNNRIELK
ncbi:MAG: GLPGLI family protein [Ginsengibacter sp.]